MTRRVLAALALLSFPTAIVTACGTSSSAGLDEDGAAASGGDAATRCADGAPCTATPGSSGGPGGNGPGSGDAALGGDGAAFGDANVACDVGPLAKGDRVVVVKNLCPAQTISVGVNGGYVTDCGPGGTCPSGSTCSNARQPAGCFWDFPKPKCGAGALKTGESATYVLDATPRPVGPPGSQVTVKWSGNVYASTDCDAAGNDCKTARCARSVDGKTLVEACKSGTGPQGPATLAEFTFVPAGPDYYDISAINGVNVPVSMGPLAGSTKPGDPYFCGTGGATTASGTGLPACSWQFDPNIALPGGASDQSTLLRAVTPGGAACTTDAQCAAGAGERCGTALAFGTTTANRSCGKPIGWWTGNQICVQTNNAFGAPLDCSGAVAGQGKRADLFECAGANPGSCYQPNASATCCGCPDWTIAGTKLPVAPGFNCFASNPQWRSVAEPWAAFPKKACPTAYSFPFDDPTSTFTCHTPNPTNENPNSTHYEIVFCPGGKDGR